MTEFINKYIINQNHNFMKKIKYLLAVMLLGCSTMSFAQFMNSGSGRSSSSSSSSDVETWKGLRFSYDCTFMSYDDDTYGDDLWKNYNGFSFGYVQSIKIAPKLPIFFETGAGINFGRFKFKDWLDVDDLDYSSTFLGLTIPLNFVYGVKVNENLTIKPYTGFFLRVNLLGKGKLSSSDDDIQDILDEEDEDTSINYFDKDDMGGNKYKWKRCQFGWQIGTMFDINNFNVGISYALDFNELAKDLKTSKFSVTLGYNF